MRSLYFLASALLLLAGCKKAEPIAMEKSMAVEVSESREHTGKKLMEINCYACHSATAPMVQGRIAPPMAAVKAHYLISKPSKEEFIQKIEAFVTSPSEELSIMPGAVDKYKLMPFMAFPENAVRQIADFMYDNQIEEPDWFQEHWNNGPGFVRAQGARPERRGRNYKFQH